MGLPGMNPSTMQGFMCFAQGHNTVGHLHPNISWQKPEGRTLHETFNLITKGHVLGVSGVLQ